MSFKIQRHQGLGFSLIEVLVAVAIMSFGLLALASLQISLVRSSAESKSQSVAISLAKDKLEDLRTYSAISGYQNITDSSAAESISMGGSTYSRTWTVARYAYPTSGSDFALVTSDTGTTSSSYVADNEFKRIVVSVSWNDATGAAQSVSVEDAIGALSPADSAKLTKPQKNTRPRGPEVIIANPEATGGVIPIAIGNGSETAATNPRPEIVSQGQNTTVVETRFDVLTYAALNSSTARAQQRVETAVIGCTCSAASGTASGFRPAYWDGLRYLPPTSYSYSVVGTAANVTQSTRCTACCRDHHDPSGVTGPKFDPRRTDGHKHFNTSLASGDYVTSGTYREACRMIRVDGFWRTAPDLFNDYFGLLATGPIPEGGTFGDGSTTAPSTATAGKYESFVLDYLNARYVAGSESNMNSPASYTGTVTSKEAEYVLNPGTTIISAATAPKWTHSRGLYIDYLEQEAKSLIAESKGTNGCGSTNACILKYVPFTSINLTEISNWASTIATSPFTASTATIQVSNNSFATSLTDTNPVRGKVLLGSPANPNSQGNAKPSITASNAGVALFSAVDADTDSTVLSDAQTFEISSGSPPNPGGGTFSVTTSGLTIDAGVVANPPKVTFTISSISVNCNTAGASVIPYGCTTTTGQSLGGLVSLQVANYNRANTGAQGKTVQNSCTNSPNDTTTMPYQIVMDINSASSSNGASVVSGVTPTNDGAVGLPAAGGEYSTFTVNPLASGDTITVAFSNSVTYRCPSNYSTYITDNGDDAGKSPTTAECGGVNNGDPDWSTTYGACPTGGTPLTN